MPATAHTRTRPGTTNAFTLLEKLGSWWVAVTILGDILFSRAARSNIICRKSWRAGHRCAPTLGIRRLPMMGARVCHDLRLLEDDAVMLLRIQHERCFQPLSSIGEYKSMFS